jgi:hypothetical protein
MRNVERANRRLAKAGIADRFDIVIEPYSVVKVNKLGENIEVERAKVTLNRPRISFNGYRFLARIEEASPGKFVAFSAPGVELDGWRPTSMECEHCKKTRARSKVYVIVDEAGVFKTVGGSCVQLYTGLSPQSLWALEWDDIDDYANEDWEEAGSLAGPRVYNTLSVLALTSLLTSETGYRSTSYPNCTRDEILRAYNSKEREIRAIYDPLLNAAEGIDGDAIKADILEGINAAPKTDWVTNIEAVIEGEWVVEKHLGILASSILLVEKAAKARKAAAEFVDGWCGNPSDKLRDIEATVVSIYTREEYYGYRGAVSYMVTFKSVDGYKLFWKTGAAYDLDLGDKVVLRGTIRSLDEYRGVKSTRLSHVKYKIV